MTNDNGLPFTTKDQDNDHDYSDNCAVNKHGAWWYSWCSYSNLNGIYHQEQYKGLDSIHWDSWKYNPLKRAEMKIRPVGF